VRSVDGQTVYVAGWEGDNNSCILFKFSASGATLDWYNRIGAGWGSRFTDIDIDASGNVYLATDIRGVYTSLGVVKCSDAGNVLWSKQYYGLNNDINNISCLRIINGKLYVGGRGSLENYDTSQFGDGLLLRISLAGALEEECNYFTNNSSDKCGERIEAILHDGSSFYLMGETWPKYSLVDGDWYLPTGIWTTLTVSESLSTTCSTVATDGSVSSTVFTVSSNAQTVRPTSSGSAGSSDFIIFKISTL
jgi:hypothetical protein